MIHTNAYEDARAEELARLDALEDTRPLIEWFKEIFSGADFADCDGSVTANPVGISEWRINISLERVELSQLLKLTMLMERHGLRKMDYFYGQNSQSDFSVYGRNGKREIIIEAPRCLQATPCAA